MKICTKSHTETLKTTKLFIVDATVLIDITIKSIEDINIDTESMNNLIDIYF